MALLTRTTILPILTAVGTITGTQCLYWAVNGQQLLSDAASFTSIAVFIVVAGATIGVSIRDSLARHISNENRATRCQVRRADAHGTIGHVARRPSPAPRRDNVYRIH